MPKNKQTTKNRVMIKWLLFFFKKKKDWKGPESVHKPLERSSAQAEHTNNSFGGWDMKQEFMI